MQLEVIDTRRLPTLDNKVGAGNGRPTVIWGPRGGPATHPCSFQARVVVFFQSGGGVGAPPGEVPRVRDGVLKQTSENRHVGQGP